MSGIAERLASIRRRMDEACLRSSRAAGSVRLLAVSKTFPPMSVREALGAGQIDFGESRQQEGAEKIAAVGAGPRWHFIGKLQRNKVRKVIADFQVLHSIDSIRLAESVDRIAGELGVRPEIFIEVNVAGEASKSGFRPEDLSETLPRFRQFSNVSVSGLMAIPPAVDEAEAARPWFCEARKLRDELVESTGIPLPGLSMGMSSDFEVAIEEGATIVRVGSAIFGNRDYA